MYLFIISHKSSKVGVGFYNKIATLNNIVHSWVVCLPLLVTKEHMNQLLLTWMLNLALVHLFEHSCGVANVNGFVHLLPTFCLHFIHSPHNCPKFFYPFVPTKVLCFWISCQNNQAYDISNWQNHIHAHHNHHMNNKDLQSRL